MKDWLKSIKYYFLAKQRVKIAKDALRHYELGNIQPGTGAVLINDNIAGKLRASWGKQFELRGLLKSEGQCKVCQRGGLLYAYVYAKNNFKVSCDLTSSSVDVVGNRQSGTFAVDAQRKLEKIFSREQLAAMETAFEGTYNYNLLGRDVFADCLKFRRCHNSIHGESTIFVAILKNIIRNKGTFKPTDLR